MTLRTMLGTGWSILTGVVGGWLVLMPWALNVQGGGDWTLVTKVSFGTGIGLLAFCLIGLVVTGGLVFRAVAPPRRAREPQPEAQAKEDQESLDRALLQLATKLVADLEAPAAGAAPQTGEQPTDVGPASNGNPARPQAPVGVPAGPAQGGTTPSGGDAPTWRRVER